MVVAGRADQAEGPEASAREPEFIALRQCGAHASSLRPLSRHALGRPAAAHPARPMKPCGRIASVSTMITNVKTMP